jgi:hypothetical protein
MLPQSEGAAHMTLPLTLVLLYVGGLVLRLDDGHHEEPVW